MTTTRRSPRAPAGSSPRVAAREEARSASEERIHRMLSGVRAAGLKLTPQRVAIVRAIADDPTHPTAQEIFDRLQSTMPTMSFATVYNTLAALTNAGLCDSLSLSPGPARFDPNMAPHHHAVCDGCGLVRDVPRDAAPAEPARPASPAAGAPALSGFEVRMVEHIYRGLCAACAASAARAAGSPSRGAPPPAVSPARHERRST